MPTRLSAVVVLMTLSLAASHAAAAVDTCWDSLTFAASRGFLSASIELQFQHPDPTSDMKASLSELRVDFKAMRSHGELAIQYQADTLNAPKRLRISHGRNSRAKEHTVNDRSVVRERREQQGDNKRAIEDWPITSSNRFALPDAHATDAAVLSPTLLLIEAARMTARDEQTREVDVFTDKQLYRVRLERQPAEQMDVDLVLNSNGSKISLSGDRAVTRFRILPTLLNLEDEDEPFKLLELSGELSIAIDNAYLIPVLVEGSWFRIGRIPAALSEASLNNTGTQCARQVD